MRVFGLLKGRQGWVAVIVVMLTLTCGVFVTFLSVMDGRVATPDPLVVACYGEDPNSILPSSFANFINLQSGPDFVVCIGSQQESVFLDRCEFQNFTVDRYAFEMEMWLVNQDTGEEFVRGMVRGEEPPACETGQFAVAEGQTFSAVQGQPVRGSDIELWLEPYFATAEVQE